MRISASRDLHIRKIIIRIKSNIISYLSTKCKFPYITWDKNTKTCLRYNPTIGKFCMPKKNWKKRRAKEAFFYFLVLSVKPSHKTLSKCCKCSCSRISLLMKVYRIKRKSPRRKVKISLKKKKKKKEREWMSVFSSFTRPKLSPIGRTITFSVTQSKRALSIPYWITIKRGKSDSKTWDETFVSASGKTLSHTMNHQHSGGERGKKKKKKKKKNRSKSSDQGSINYL